MKRKVPYKGKSFSFNWVRRIFAGYISLLVICTIVVMFFTGKDSDDFKKAPIANIEKEGNALLGAAVAGKFATIESDLIEKKWNLAYHEPKLNLTTGTDQYFGAQIYVERKNTNDDKIEAIVYRTRSSMNDMDISKLINPIRLKLAGNLLTLQNPKQVKLKFSMFNNVFAVTQFTGEDSLFEHNSSFYDGQSILYMRIPKDLELIDKSHLSIQYVK